MLKGFVNYISSMGVFTKTLWILLILWGLWELIQYFRRKGAATELEYEEFNKNIRKSQLIDVREKSEFDSKHILGARNIPYYEMKQRHIELRKDQPIFLYEDSSYLAYRTAIELRKHGFKDLYVLKDGLDKWPGRIKSK